MPWTWNRLRSVVAAADLPAGHHVVGATGALLASGELATAHEVDLLVTHEVLDCLAGEGWQAHPLGLAHPDEHGLVAHTGQDDGSYNQRISGLFAVAQSIAGIPVVPESAVHPRAMMLLRRYHADSEPAAASVAVPARMEGFPPMARGMLVGARPAVGCLALGVALMALVLGALAVQFSSGWPHVLGLTDEVDATVVSVAERDHCGDDNDGREFRYELEWEQDGETRSGHDDSCESGSSRLPGEEPRADHEVGDRYPVWVEGDGDVAGTSSPLMVRLLFGGSVVIITGCAVLALRYGRRKSVTSEV